MYGVYRNQAAAAAYSSLFFFLFFSLQFSIFHFFSGTVRPRRLKFDIHVDNGWMYHVYWNQAAAAYFSLYSVFFPIFKH